MSLIVGLDSLFSQKEVIINEPVGSKFDKTLALSGRVWIQSKSFGLFPCMVGLMKSGLNIRINNKTSTEKRILIPFSFTVFQDLRLVLRRARKSRRHQADEEHLVAYLLSFLLHLFANPEISSDDRWATINAHSTGPAWKWNTISPLEPYVCSSVGHRGTRERGTVWKSSRTIFPQSDSEQILSTEAAEALNAMAAFCWCAYIACTLPSVSQSLSLNHH